MNIKNIAIAITATCCIGSCQVKDKYTALDGEWDVVSIENSAIPDSIEAYIGFDVKKRLIFGYAGCNYITGNIPTGNKEALFATLASTRKMCPHMTTENTLIEALAKAHDFEVHDGVLNLLDTKNHTLVSLKRR